MAEVVERVRQETGRRHPHELVFCSRSGSPQIPWLEPDVNDHLEQLHADGRPGVVMVPIGFVSDHMEVVYDLDTEALATAEKLGLPATRAATAGHRPAVRRRRARPAARAGRRRARRGRRPRAPSARWPACWDRCAVGCCPNPRAERPALSQVDA